MNAWTIELEKEECIWFSVTVTSLSNITHLLFIGIHNKPFKDRVKVFQPPQKRHPVFEIIAYLSSKPCQELFQDPLLASGHNKK